MSDKKGVTAQGSNAAVVSRDSEYINYLEMLSHGYTVKLTRDWTYEVIVNEKTYKGTSLRDAIKNCIDAKSD